MLSLIISSNAGRILMFLLETPAAVCSVHDGERPDSGRQALRALSTLAQAVGFYGHWGGFLLLVLFLDETKRLGKHAAPLVRQRCIVRLRRLALAALAVVAIVTGVVYTLFAVHHLADVACQPWLSTLEDRDWHSFVFFSTFILTNSLLFVLTGGPLLLFECGAAVRSARCQLCGSSDRADRGHSCWAPHVRARLLAVFALVVVAVSLVGRGVINVQLLVTECQCRLTLPGVGAQFTQALLETVPFVCVLIAFGEQIASTSFTLDGVLPWTYRVTRRELPAITRRIGEGTFGVVSQGTWRGQQVALKELKASGVERAELTANLEREAMVLSRVAHPNIVRFLGEWA